jgi:hypothetical protein
MAAIEFGEDSKTKCRIKELIALYHQGGACGIYGKHRLFVRWLTDEGDGESDDQISAMSQRRDRKKGREKR